MKDCTSLDVSIKLKEAGWKQDACAIAYFFDGSEPYLMDIDHWSMAEGEFGGAKGLCWKPKCKEDYHYHEAIAAPTIGELLEALPDTLGQDKNGFKQGLALWKCDPDRYVACYSATGSDEKKWVPNKYSPNPADALALLYIELKKKGLV